MSLGDTKDRLKSSTKHLRIIIEEYNGENNQKVIVKVLRIE